MTDLPDSSVFFIGDVALDEYFSAARWPGLADKAFVQAGRRYVGGMVANAACVFAGLGGKAEFISLLGTGAVGDELCDALAARGVSTRHMMREPGVADPRTIIVLVDREHVVLSVDTGRPPMWLDEPAIEALMRPGFLYTTLYRAPRLRAGTLHGPALFAAFQRAGRRAVFDLDVDGFGEADLGYLRGAAVVILNRAGFARSFGDGGPSTIRDWMAEHEVGLVVRTLGAEGAEVHDGRQVLHRPAYPVPVVDVTGAGDAFGGALVLGLSRGLGAEAALDLALAAASRAVTIEGPQGGVATLANLKDFAARYGRPFPAVADSGVQA